MDLISSRKSDIEAFDLKIDVKIKFNIILKYEIRI